jgi:thiamine kinase-like enzyme
MKLNELKRSDIKHIKTNTQNIVKSYDADDDWLDMDEKLDALMTSKGFNKAGEGFFSKVYTKNNLALKVTTEDDPCAYEFYLYCAKQNNLHLPRCMKPIKIDKSKFIVVVEILEPLKQHMSYEDLELFKSLLSIHIAYYMKNKSPHEFETHEYKLKNIIEKYGKEKIKTTLKMHRTLFQTMQRIKRAYEYSDCHIDTHAENFMVRPSTGTIVISDPVASDTGF